MLAWVEKNYKLILVVIFLLGLLTRFLYFPGNTYFAYDQARDSFVSHQVMQGNLKIVGPPSILGSQVFHGPLVYYFFGPVYFFTHNNPEAVSAALRIFNALGILIVFLIGSIIFNKKVGLLSAFIFAISYEQSQYALFFCHPGLAVIPALLFYLGLALVIFKKDPRGLILATFCLGLTVQFHLVNIFLFLPLLILGLIFHKYYRIFKFKHLGLSVLGLLVSFAPFIFSEIKFGFRLSSQAIAILGSSFGKTSTLPKGGWGRFFASLQRLIQDNLISFSPLDLIMFMLVVGSFAWLILQKKLRPQGIFLLVWLLGSLIVYYFLDSPTYYFSPGASVSFLILLAFISTNLRSKWIMLPILLLSLTVVSNFYKITTINPQGLNTDFIIQPGMILSDQRQVLDYVYQHTSNKQLAVRALTIPLNVNTTWSYLFEWYGKNKYGYLPTWIGPIAQGFPGNLPVTLDRGSLPQQYFLIIEPPIGIREGIQEDFFQTESYFTKLVEEKKFGTLRVQLRQRY